MSIKTSPKTGRPVNIVSLGFQDKAKETILALVDKEGSRGGVDLIVLPETCNIQSKNQPETLDGPTITAMSELAKKHQTYIVCPIDRKDGTRRLNSAVLINREGKVVCVYDKRYPWWSEFNLTPVVEPGQNEPIAYQTDFGLLGLAICFDVNFPSIWQTLSENGAELVIWPSAYSAGTSLQAHAINHHYHIVTSTYTPDCLVFDITGKQILHEKGNDINISHITLDLDRGIYHNNFNLAKRDKLLAEHGEEVELEQCLENEQWFVLRAKSPGASARLLARQYGLEELRDYLKRSKDEIDQRRKDCTVELTHVFL